MHIKLHIVPVWLLVIGEQTWMAQQKAFLKARVVSTMLAVHVLRQTRAGMNKYPEPSLERCAGPGQELVG